MTKNKNLSCREQYIGRTLNRDSYIELTEEEMQSAIGYEDAMKRVTRGRTARFRIVHVQQVEISDEEIFLRSGIVRFLHERLGNAQAVGRNGAYKIPRSYAENYFKLKTDFLAYLERRIAEESKNRCATTP